MGGYRAAGQDGVEVGQHGSVLWCEVEAVGIVHAEVVAGGGAPDSVVEEAAEVERKVAGGEEGSDGGRQCLEVEQQAGGEQPGRQQPIAGPIPCGAHCRTKALDLHMSPTWAMIPQRAGNTNRKRLEKYRSGTPATCSCSGSATPLAAGAWGHRRKGGMLTVLLCHSATLLACPMLKNFWDLHAR